MLMLLGSMGSEARLATFLLDLTQRLHKRGFSSLSVNLRMTRKEIGSYLGLKLETVSRTFSKPNGIGTLAVSGREIQILDMESLQRVASGVC